MVTSLWFKFLISLVNSFLPGTIISAAAEGVGALKSATKSAMVKSIWCPTAETMGILLAKIARATFSSLKAHKSSKEPPPLPTISTSTALNWLNSSRACAISSAAPSPWTRTGLRISSMAGFLLPAIFIMSRMAAPVAEVTMPILWGNSGMGFLCSSSNKPSLKSFSFNCWKANSNLPMPTGWMSSR